jgi:outer membrane protein OmpA-like peptidoglycan-associated protein
MKRFPIFLLFAVMSSFATSAKENQDLMKAHYYYDHNAFGTAITWYEKAIEQSSDALAFARLADCYRITGAIDKAVATYAKATGLQNCPDGVWLQYGQMLMQQTKYDEAQTWFKKYQAKYKGDRRVANLVKACGENPQLLRGIPTGIAKLATFNSDGSDMAPTFWKGKLVFASDVATAETKKGGPYYGIYSVTCDGSGNCNNDMHKAVLDPEINTGLHSGPSTFTADGKQMFYSRSRQGGANIFSNKAVAGQDTLTELEIMIATEYDQKNNNFRTLTPFQYNSTSYSVQHPAISPNGKLLVFASNMPKGTGGLDLYFCKRSGRDKWSKPQSVGAVINTEGQEVFPYWADDKTLFFSSDGQGGFGGLDIYKSAFDSAGSKFNTPEHIDMPINSPNDDISMALFADGRSSWFSSNRPATIGGDNVYFYKKEKVFLNLLVRDSLTGQPVPNSKVAMVTAKHTADGTTGDDGRMIAQLYPEQQYNVTINDAAYPPFNFSVQASGIRETDTINRFVTLYTDARLNFTQNLDGTSKELGAPSPTPMQPTSFAKLVGTPQVDKIYEIGHFYFAYKSTELNDTAKAVLDSLASYLKQKPSMRIQVRAHTDCRGGSAYNMKLSSERAATVANYIVQKGITAKRVEHKGFGDTMPVVPCPGCQGCTEEQHFLNRVLNFKVLQL